jgi:hypothetical protein
MQLTRPNRPHRRSSRCSDDFGESHGGRTSTGEVASSRALVRPTTDGRGEPSLRSRLHATDTRRNPKITAVLLGHRFLNEAMISGLQWVIDEQALGLGRRAGQRHALGDHARRLSP